VIHTLWISWPVVSDFFINDYLTFLPMEITRFLSIIDDELTFTYVRASGPGGQNVNKVATAAKLRFDVRHSPSVPREVKERLEKLAGNRMTQDGVLIIEAKRYRTQEQNRVDALLRLRVLLEKAEQRPRVRQATRPSMSAHRRRLESKKKRAAVKKQRQPVEE
jgi:ribosome-associated protein